MRVDGVEQWLALEDWWRVPGVEVALHSVDVNGKITKSIATLSADGKTLEGESFALLDNKEAPEGRTKVSYKWKAIKGG